MTAICSPDGQKRCIKTIWCPYDIAIGGGWPNFISKSLFRAIIYASVTCFRFPICCSVSKLQLFKGKKKATGFENQGQI